MYTKARQYSAQNKITRPPPGGENLPAHLTTILLSTKNPDQAIHPQTIYNTYDRVVIVETSEVSL